MTTYEIVVRTGTESGAGTDADVFLTLYGERGIAHQVQLGNDDDNFEAGDVDRFIKDLEDVGDLRAARVWHDNSGSRPGWFLDQIVVTKQDPPITQWVFPLHDWLASDEPGGTERMLFPAGGGGRVLARPERAEADLLGNWESVAKELETRIGGAVADPAFLTAAALANSTAAATAFFGVAPDPVAGDRGGRLAQARGGTVVRAFWWGFHVQFSHEDLVTILDSADMINTTVAVIGGNIPSPAAPWIKMLAPFVAALHNGLRSLDHGNGIYVSMSWFAPGVFVPTTV
ncbi:PLAT/LH2 domain-containing protein [Paractinoplanes atraurantiacus]|uniref:PLAT/LH2 domain-containing protein n=1 Tax=Paractinoplanes atraurantiacus TaxID=1036182 RepID=A0A285IXQ4_9ACTN|nr:PLAT/LH2 domain-containing protein [Actinoplanes atraurantiacus]SNY52477.1 PLAT/LH2 domain-containing protein [Actinoplanes atraurantiacus]